MDNLRNDEAKKIYEAIKKSKLKYYTIENLSNDIGIYQDILASKLSMFNPLMALDTSFNLKEIEKDLKEFLDKKNSKTKKNKVVDPELAKYKSLNDFIYQKYASLGGGLIDRNVVLSKKDLNILKKLIMLEKKNKK